MASWVKLRFKFAWKNPGFSSSKTHSFSVASFRIDSPSVSRTSVGRTNCSIPAIKKMTGSVTVCLRMCITRNTRCATPCIGKDPVSSDSTWYWSQRRGSPSVRRILAALMEEFYTNGGAMTWARRGLGKQFCLFWRVKSSSFKLFLNWAFIDQNRFKRLEVLCFNGKFWIN